jgi:hypothetical protein
MLRVRTAPSAAMSEAERTVMPRGSIVRRARTRDCGLSTAMLVSCRELIRHLE